MSEDFFGDLGKSISKYTQSAVEKANTVLETTKISAQISTETKEIDKLYQKIGETIVKRAVDDGMLLDPSLQTYVDEIKTHNSQILIYKKQLADVKGMKVCPSCRELIAKDVAFCPKCGSPTEVDAEPEKKSEPAKAPESAVDAEFEAVDEVKIAEEVAEELQAEAEKLQDAAEEAREAKDVVEDAVSQMEDEAEES